MPLNSLYKFPQKHLWGKHLHSFLNRLSSKSKLNEAFSGYPPNSNRCPRKIPWRNILRPGGDVSLQTWQVGWGWKGSDGMWKMQEILCKFKRYQKQLEDGRRLNGTYDIFLWMATCIRCNVISKMQVNQQFIFAFFPPLDWITPCAFTRKAAIKAWEATQRGVWPRGGGWIDRWEGRPWHEHVALV